MRYLIIGSGKMARHFCYYLALLKIDYQQWTRKTHTLAELDHYLSDATHILLLISDSAITDFYQQLPKQSSQIFVHFSGALSVPEIYSAHPLMTFTDDLYSLEIYKTVPFILETESLATLLPQLPNKAYLIPSALKSYYHAMCVMSNNFTSLLWRKFFQEMTTTLQLPADVGLPYLKQTCLNIANNPNALTGPLARGDDKTIHMHRQALAQDPYLDIYEAFVSMYQGENK